MAVRYRNTFYSIDGIAWQVDIYDNTYSGIISTLTTDRKGFTLAYRGVTERLDPIMASTLTVPVLVTSQIIEAFINETMTAQEERFSAKVYKNGVLDWCGLLLPDQVQREDIAYPYYTDLTFTDGLARLRDIDYNDNEYPFPLYYTGAETIIQHLLKCLVKTGLSGMYGASETFLATVVNWYDAKHQYSSFYDPLVYTKLSHLAFWGCDSGGTINYMKADEVLRMILQTFNAQVKMSRGKFYIIQPQEYSRSSTYCREYTKTGTAITRYTANFRVTPTVRKAGGIVKYYGPLRSVKKIYKVKISPTENGSIIVPQTRYTLTVPFLNTIQADNILNFEGDIVENFYTTALGTQQFYSVFVFKIVVTKLSTGQKLYLTNNGSTGEYRWSTSSGDWIAIATPLSELNQKVWNRTTSVYFSAPPINEEISGTFQFYYYNSYNSNGSAHTFEVGSAYGWYCQDFNLQPGTADQLLMEDQIFTATNETTSGNPVNSSMEIKPPDTFIGDDPDTFHIGRLMVSDGFNWYDSTLWGIHNSTTRVMINQLSVNQNLSGQMVPTQKYNGTFITTVVDAISSIVWGSMVFVPILLTINPADDEVNGEWFNVIIPAL